MAKKRRTGLRLHPMVEVMAQRLMLCRGFATLTALVEQLIRDESDRRSGELEELTPQQAAAVAEMVRNAADAERSKGPESAPRETEQEQSSRPSGKHAPSERPETDKISAKRKSRRKPGLPRG